MSTANPIETNSVDSAGVTTSTASNSVGKFSSVLDATAYAAQLAGPAGYYTAAQYSPSSSDIVGAAVNATAGYSGGGTGMLTTGGTYSGAVSNYYGGGSLAATTSGFGVSTSSSSTSDTLAASQQLLAESQMSNVQMLMVQEEAGQQNRHFSTVSNVISARDTMLAAIIRNVRGV